MRSVILVIAVSACVSVSFGQAITGFSGGTQYDSYYGSAPGDVVGFRFTVSQSVQVTDLGIWNADQTGGIESPHQIGIWDASEVLLASVTVDATGTVVGAWIYESIAPVVIAPGQTYTLGALYLPSDNDWYISGASSVSTATEVTWLSSVYPASGGLGFVFPASTSASFGRFGPNFIFSEVSLDRTSWGAIKSSF